MKSNIQKRKSDLKEKNQTKKAIDVVRQRGASSWLNAIPLEQYGFSFKKSRI